MISNEGAERSIVFEVLLLNLFPARSVMYPSPSLKEKAKVVSIGRDKSESRKPRYNPSGSFTGRRGSEEPVNSVDIIVVKILLIPLEKFLSGTAYGFVLYLKEVPTSSFVDILIPPVVRRVLSLSNWRIPPIISEQ